MVHKNPVLSPSTVRNGMLLTSIKILPGLIGKEVPFFLGQTWVGSNRSGKAKLMLISETHGARSPISWFLTLNPVSLWQRDLVDLRINRNRARLNPRYNHMMAWDTPFSRFVGVVMVLNPIRIHIRSPLHPFFLLTGPQPWTLETQLDKVILTFGFVGFVNADNRDNPDNRFN